jgi:hypothetical protein
VANLIYTNPGTALVFKDSGGDAVITLASLASGGGRLSAQYDRGAGAKPALYRWQLRWRANSAPTVAATNVVRLYLVPGDDGSYVAGGLGTADAAVTPEAFLANTEFLGAAEVTEASTSRDFVRQGYVWVRSRYVSVAVWNASGVALHATASNNEVRLTPVPDEIQ